jgi:hypothetical protein
MATLRIKFPQKEEPSVIVLRGDRITVGRRPNNTVQILDRTVSAFHAELIREDGHYRLHDLGSANGTSVNGETVRDFHLRESCKIIFGAVACEFDSADVDEAPEGLPTQAELTALLKNNQMLKAQLDTVRTELAALRVQSPLNGEGASPVPREEFEKVVLDRASLSERLQHVESQLAKLREETAILRRDRENLELALDSARKEAERMRTSGAEAQAAPAPPAAEPAATPAAAAPDAAAETPAPAAPPAPAPGLVMPNLPPPSSLPQPTAIPAAVPANPVPRAMPVAATGPKSPVTPAVAVGAKPVARQMPPAGVLPSGTPRAVPQPTATPVPRAAVPKGPAGTQKISVPDGATPRATPAQPTAAAGKLPPMKPYVRPAVGSASSPSVTSGARNPVARDPRLQAQPEPAGDEAEA